MSLDLLEVLDVGWDFEIVSQLAESCFSSQDMVEYFSNVSSFGEVFKFVEDGKVVGFSQFGQVWLPDAPDVYLSFLGIDEKERGRGLGFSMLKLVIEHCVSRVSSGFSIHADVRKSNFVSQRLFWKSGFHVHVEHDMYPDEVGYRFVRNF